MFSIVPGKTKSCKIRSNVHNQAEQSTGVAWDYKQHDSLQRNANEVPDNIHDALAIGLFSVPFLVGYLRTLSLWGILDPFKNINKLEKVAVKSLSNGTRITYFIEFQHCFTARDMHDVLRYHARSSEHDKLPCIKIDS